MKFSPWPRSLFGRLVGVLVVGFVLAQGLSAWINWAERDRVLLEAAGMQPVQRVADIVRLLDSLDASERGRIVRILNVPPLVVTLDRSIDVQVSRLRHRLGDDPKDPQLIKTVRGEGYVLAVAVTGLP